MTRGMFLVVNVVYDIVSKANDDYTEKNISEFFLFFIGILP